MRVRALALHSRYRCRRSGACCSSGWTIPVEPESERRIAAALRAGTLPGRDGTPWARPLAPAGAPAAADRARVALRVLSDGACVFLDARGTPLCAVHDRLGEDALPAACRQFPRVVTQTPLGVSVTLSHYCPTAAGLLLEPSGTVAEDSSLPRVRSARAMAAGDPRLRIVEAPPAFPADWPFEGLDARSALPPFLRPGVLMSWPAFERWEEHAVGVLATDCAPEAALARLGADAERARAWTPSAGGFDAFLGAVLGSSVESTPPGPGASSPGDASSWQLVAGCVPAGATLPEPPPHDSAGLVSAGWGPLAAPIRRWLAARAFASWAALQGQGLRTSVAALAASLGVLRAECARGCAVSGRPLDGEQLLAAVRRADLLLVHLVDPERLARRLSGCEAERGR